MEQDLQGKIGRFTLPDIFQLIADSRKTGTLGIQRDGDIVMIYFKKGKIVYGYGPRQAWHLGELLKEKSIITQDQLNDAVKTQAETANSKRLGQILIEKNYISRSDLEIILRRQIEELIYSLLSWDNGSFKFYENQYPTEEEITVNISVENAILEGIRRLDEQNRMNEIFPDTNLSLSLTPSPSERQSEISLKSEEWSLIAQIDGCRTIEEIACSQKTPKFEVLNRLAGLKLAGLITTTDGKKPTADHLAGMVEDLAGLLERYLSKKSSVIPNEKTTLQSPEEITIDITSDHSEY
jgi:hypothetical protein